MLRNEASSSPCIAALHIEEDSSLSLRMTNIYWLSYHFTFIVYLIYKLIVTFNVISIRQILLDFQK
ncbi:MAG: hypothetical protein JWQ57_2917 [Mucilaginibacter sp.]|nr:hypothetical protein [Mucilaginibacter sp.]